MHDVSTRQLELMRQVQAANTLAARCLGTASRLIRDRSAQPMLRWHASSHLMFAGQMETALELFGAWPQPLGGVKYLVTRGAIELRAALPGARDALLGRCAHTEARVARLYDELLEEPIPEPLGDLLSSQYDNALDALRDILRFRAQA